MYGDNKRKWNEHIDGLVNANSLFTEQGDVKLYAYQAILEFENGNYRLSGFNLGQMMKMIKMNNNTNYNANIQ